MRKDRNQFNLIMGVLYPLETLIANFFVKQAVRFQLGTDYLGLQNVYTNYCDILAFAFAGIGIAMMFRLYKPIEMQDTGTVAKLFHLFDRIYRYFVLGAGVVGLLVTGLVVLSVRTAMIGAIEVAAGFLLYLFSSLIYNRFYIYYFYLSSWQKRYAACLIHSLTDLLALSVEIGCLVLFRNYLIFLCSIVLKNMVEAAILYGYSNRQFPFLRERKRMTEEAAAKGALRDVRHMILAKIGNLLVGSTDSILISGLVSTFAAGCYSNYYFLYLGLTTLTSSFYESIMNRVGKLLVTQDRETQFRHFLRVSVLNLAVTAVVVNGFYWLSEDFITLWMGRDLLLGREVVLLISINLYMVISRHTVSIYRQSAGLFEMASRMILFWGILNLILSAVLGHFFGIFGILLATSVTDFLTIYWYEPFIMYRYFQKNMAYAVLYEVAALAATISSVWLTGLVVQKIPASDWLLLIGKSAALIALNAVWLLLILGLPSVLVRRRGKRTASPADLVQPKISVVIAVYNVKPYLSACLDSVAAQTYQNLEILIVDDGSEDGGDVICEDFTKRESRTRLIRQENRGLSDARNRGLSEAKGEYISFLDGDDILDPDYFACLVHQIQEARADVSVVSYRVIRQRSRRRKLQRRRRPAILLSGREAVEQILKDHEPFMITAWGKLYHKSLWPLLSYPSGKIHEDEFITYKVFYHAERVAVSKTKRYGLRIRKGSITSGFDERRLSKLEALQECIGWMEARGEVQLASYAKLRYLLNLEIAWYRVNTKMKGAKDLEAELIARHEEAVKAYREEVWPLSGLAERCAVRIFRFRPAVYRFFARSYQLLFRERN